MTSAPGIASVAGAPLILATGVGVMAATLSLCAALAGGPIGVA